MKRLLLAFQFLTIVPVGDTADVREEEMGRATAFFPFVGLIEGLVLLIFAALCIRVFPAEVINGLLVLAMVVLNGGLHLDGLADTFDAVASRGDREKKHAIMKDSTIGPTGVTSIVLALLLKYVLLNAIFFRLDLNSYYAVVLLLPVLSRWAMVPTIYHGRPGREDGLGKTFIDHTGKRELLTATVITIAVSFAAFSLMSGLSLLTFNLMFVMPLLYLFSFTAVWFCGKILHGMTGDTFGAVNETAVLLTLVMFCVRNTPPV